MLRSQCTCRANALEIETSASAVAKILRAVFRICWNCSSRSSTGMRRIIKTSSGHRVIPSVGFESLRDDDRFPNPAFDGGAQFVQAAFEEVICAFNHHEFLWLRHRRN